ncbi:p40 [Sucra jujuba nucleopolyhedrovirus]|uniref:p40 n=1 Tax=Sucra jujuba nucleopolyhedrovirus TaxID=1563660 RepID=A0A097P925_9ABAC|nr:p40 [Sucra jujuba nucleopolyhedrovirus]AIU41323.1 p40 [Sucra jujuba nucleopolyhedrovirus]
MSSIDLFNEMVILRDKIDPQMQMDIWPKLFHLLPGDDPSGSNNSNNTTINISFSEFTDFFTTVAQAGANRMRNDNAALASEHFAGGNVVNFAPSTNVPSAPAQPPRRSILNLFQRDTSVRESSDENLTMLRNTCQKVLQYYTLSTTSTTEFKVRDIVCCMLYLSKTKTYRPLYNYLESGFGDECNPSLTPDQIYFMTNLLRNLLNLPSSTVDYDNLKLLRSNVGKMVNYPLTRFARIIIMPDDALIKQKPMTLEDLVLERAEKIANLEPQQYVDGRDNQIPYCDDEEFINRLAYMTHDFSLERMFYNAANSIFYTTMENYALSNCKFEVSNYNNIFKSMDEYKKLSEQCGIRQKNAELTDSLNIYLNGYNCPTNTKRKKY